MTTIVREKGSGKYVALQFESGFTSNKDEASKFEDVGSATFVMNSTFLRLSERNMFVYEEYTNG